MITVIGSLKGGSGKSTTSFNLAVWLLSQGKNAAIFDLDPQQTLTDAAEFRAEDGWEPALAPISREDIGDIKKALLKAGKDYDEVLVDIGNSDMDAVHAAYQAADRIIVPVLPSQSDVWSLQRFLKSLKSLKGKKRNLEVVTYINRADTHYAVLETVETIEVLNQLPGTTFVKKMLGQRTSFRRAFSEGLSVFEMEPRGKAAAEFLLLAKALYPKSRRK